MASEGKGSRGRLLAGLALLAFGILLALRPTPGPAETEGLGLIDLRSWRAMLSLALDLLGRALALVAWHVPVGFLAVLALHCRPSDVRGRLLLWLEACLLGVFLVAVVAAFRLRSSGMWPVPLELLLPATGVVAGTWPGLAWTRGWRARLFFLPRLAGLLVVLALLAVGALWLALEGQPLDFAPAVVTSAGKRQAYARVREGPVVATPLGEAREIRLAAEDLDVLLAWGLSIGATGAKARVLLADEQARVDASVALPRSRHLNVRAAGRVRIEGGRPTVEALSLRVGRLSLPRLVLQPLVGVTLALLTRDRRMRPVLEAIVRLDHDASAVKAVVRRRAIPNRLLLELVRGEPRRPEDEAAVRAQLARLLQPTEVRSPDERFAEAQRLAFTLARDRSREGTAVRENRSALLALGVVLGTPRLELVTGPLLHPQEVRRGGESPWSAALRGRVDWSRHFAVSGALTVLAFDTASDAAGLFKEELDADGGSGFSFADLLADRAGTLFAERATRDEASARAVQERVARGFRVDDFFPSAEGLPEGIPDTLLHSQYGGVGGPGYRELDAEIERRLSACAGLQDR